MVYIEAQDKKLKFGIKTSELQAGWFDPKSRISKHKKAITYSFKAQIASRFFQCLKNIIS